MVVPEILKSDAWKRRARKVVWHDITSYAQGTPAEKREPRTWEARFARVRVCVTRLHGVTADVWFWRINGAVVLGPNELRHRQLDEAKLEALTLATTWIESLRSGLP